MISIMDNNRKTIEQEISTLVFYMGGGLDYNDAWLLSADQREIMAKIIEKHHAQQSNKEYL
jgi:hypothetical protein